jgi:hypothetical protein
MDGCVVECGGFEKRPSFSDVMPGVLKSAFRPTAYVQKP